MNMIEELIDTQTNDGCEKLFDYLESRVDRLTAGMISTRGKGLILLRFCNELLRRLSKSQDTIFCGRILMFLASVFPLGERSGVNLRGDFNLDNKTLFDETIGVHAEPMDTVEAINGTSDPPQADDNTEQKQSKITKDEPKESDEPPPMDSFYHSFWSLQKYFNNPSLLFASPDDQGISHLEKGVDMFLEEFVRVSKRERETSGSKEKSSGQKRKAGDLDGELNTATTRTTSYFFPKFLTSRTLIELEVSDLSFRRHILIQCLILFQYLLGFTATERAAWAGLTTPNKSVQKDFVLTPEREKWIKDTTARIRSELRGSGPSRMENDIFYKTINEVLAREKNWILWKAQLCQTFEKEPLNKEEYPKAREQRQRITKTPMPYRHKLGTATLTELWKTGESNSLEDLESPSRYAAPDLEDFEEQVNAKEEELKAKKDVYADEKGDKEAIWIPDQEAEILEEQKQSLTWRALRLASRKHLHLFGKIDGGQLSLLRKAIDTEEELKNAPPPTDAEAAEAEAANGVSIQGNEPKQGVQPHDNTNNELTEAVTISSSPGDTNVPRTPGKEAEIDQARMEVEQQSENGDISEAQGDQEAVSPEYEPESDAQTPEEEAEAQPEPEVYADDDDQAGKDVEMEVPENAADQGHGGEDDADQEPRQDVEMATETS